MRKFYIVWVLILYSSITMGQDIFATISLGDVNIKELKAGDDVVVPVKLNTKSKGEIAVFQLFINFDHSVLKWKGTWEDPLPGIKNFNEKLPYSPAAWLFNDNGSQLVAIWDDPEFDGVELSGGDVFFEVIFTYIGDLKAGQKSLLTWGDNYEEVGGRLVRGKTEIYNFEGEIYNLTKIEGSLYNGIN